MQPSPKRAIRLSAPPFSVGVILFLVLFLLIGNRLDWKSAGGQGLGAHASALLLKSTDSLAKSTLERGEVITTHATAFSTYQVHDSCTVHLAENTSLRFEDGRVNMAQFGFLTGRIVAEGSCTFTLREMRIATEGTATLVHYSWLDTLDVRTLHGSVRVTQSAHLETLLTPDSSPLRFSTLPVLASTNTPPPLPISFSLDGTELVSSFYTWSLN